MQDVNADISILARRVKEMKMAHGRLSKRLKYYIPTARIVEREKSTMTTAWLV